MHTELCGRSVVTIVLSIAMETFYECIHLVFGVVNWIQCEVLVLYTCIYEWRVWGVCV